MKMSLQFVNECCHGTGSHWQPQAATGSHRQPQAATGNCRQPQAATGSHRQPQAATGHCLGLMPCGLSQPLLNVFPVAKCQSLLYLHWVPLLTECTCLILDVIVPTNQYDQVIRKKYIRPIFGKSSQNSCQEKNGKIFKSKLNLKVQTTIET
jgi:hypothetical protein